MALFWKRKAPKAKSENATAEKDGPSQGGSTTNTVGIYHVGCHNGEIEPVIAVSLDPSNIQMIKDLLQTDRIGTDEVSHYDDHYLFMFDGNASKPYKSVMIWKFIPRDNSNVLVDVTQEDLKAVRFAIDNYLK